MASEALVTRLNALIAPILAAQEMELVDLEFITASRKWLLRLFVDKPEGITLDDCARVSGIVGDLLDVHDLIEHPYTLEVSSPGLNRPLKKPADYARFAGRLVRLVQRGAAGGSVVRGELLGLEGENVTIRVGDTVHVIPLAEISRANLDFDFH